MANIVVVNFFILWILGTIIFIFTTSIFIVFFELCVHDSWKSIWQRLAPRCKGSRPQSSTITKTIIITTDTSKWWQIVNIDSLTLAPATGPRLSATEKSSCEEKSKDHQRSHPGRCFLSLFLSERKITLLYVSVQRAVRKEDQRSLSWKKMWSGGRWDSLRQTDALAPHATYKQPQWMERLPSSNYGRKEGTKGDGLCWSGHRLLACMSAKELWVLSGLGSKFWKLESKYVLGVNVAMTNQLVICLKLFSNQVSDSVMVIYIIQWPL